MSPYAETPRGPDEADSIAQAAASWVVRRDRGLDTRDAAALERWLAADPRHAAEFERIGAGWRSLENLAAVPALADAADAVVRRAHARRKRRRVVALASGCFAAAAAIALAYIGWRKTPVAPRDSFQVLASSSREINLPDGSVAQLNGTSRIALEFTGAERRVRLLEGEALFTVTKNPNRPFFVVAGPVTVRAVGTAFNVRLGSTAVEVLVTEGKVRVDDNARNRSLLPVPAKAENHATPAESEPLLTAGHRVIVNLAAKVDDATHVQVAAVASYEVDQALAWQTTRLAFNNTPLDEVVAAFNRYNTRKMALGDDSLPARRITGVFRANNLDGFTRLLEAGVDVRAEERDARLTVLLPAR